MGRFSSKKTKRSLRNCILWGLLAAAAVPGVLSTAVLYDQARQSISSFAADTAVFSALYAVPDQGLGQLEHRFSDQTAPEQPSESSPAPSTVQEDPQQPAATEEETEPEQDPSPSQTADQPDEPAADAPSSSEPPEDYSIPEEYQGPIVEEDLSGSTTGNSLTFGAGIIKNSTELSNDELQTYLQADNPIQITDDGPQVLIMHTHATESFEPYDTDIYDTRHTWRTTDNTQNIVAAGEVMAEAIRSYGIEVLHDETQHDYPSYNGSYERSAVTVQEYLEKYPSIKVVLDVHRDAVQRDQTLVKPVTEIDGRKAAQLMIIAGCDDGTMNMPNWLSLIHI